MGIWGEETALGTRRVQRVLGQGGDGSGYSGRGPDTMGKEVTAAGTLGEDRTLWARR